MGNNWRDCVITMIDLVGVKSRASDGTASSLMRQLHALVVRQMKDGLLPSVAHAYTWNDSVLLLSYVDESDLPFQAALRDADRLKRRVDRLQKSYAIAVKGRTFPQRPVGGSAAKSPRVTVIEASSWAMANCFEIQKKVGTFRKRGVWYLDSRIAGRIKTRPAGEKTKVALLPSGQRRSVHVYTDYLWPEDEV